MPSHKHSAHKPSKKSSTMRKAEREPHAVPDAAPADPCPRPNPHGRNVTREQENHITPARQ